MSIGEIIEDLKRDWEAIKDAFYDAVWWWKDVRSRQERAELRRLEQKDREESILLPLETDGMDATAKRIDTETLSVK